MSLGIEGGTPDKGGSLEKKLLDDLLSGAYGGASEVSRTAKLERQVADAVSTLDEVQQVVVNCRFGLGGAPVQSYEEIARMLTTAMTPELRQSLSSMRGIAADDVVFSAEDVAKIETQALRDLRRRPKE